MFVVVPINPVGVAPLNERAVEQALFHLIFGSAMLVLGTMVLFKMFQYRNVLEIRARCDCYSLLFRSPSAPWLYDFYSLVSHPPVVHILPCFPSLFLAQTPKSCVTCDFSTCSVRLGVLLGLRALSMCNLTVVRMLYCWER